MNSPSDRLSRAGWFCSLLLSLVMEFGASDSIAQAEPATDEVDTPSQQSAAVELARTPQGRQWLKYITSCGLSEGDQLTLKVEDSSYQFSGNLGLASDWLKQPLSASAERWASTCLLALTNAFGVTVPISVRGSHDALQAGMKPHETQLYLVEEAAFYGNIFASPAAAYVCTGEQTPSSPYLQQRVCAETSDTPPLTKCQFLLMGRCKDLCEYQDSDNGHYERCRGSDGLYSEVVTVYLKTE